MSKKHILLLSSWYPTPSEPFLGNFIVRQAELLAKDYKVTVVTCREKRDSSKIEISTSSDYTFTEITACYPRKKTVISRNLKKKKAFELALDEASNVDMIIGNVLLPHGWQFILAKKKFKCPLVYVEHGSYFRKDARSYWRKIDHMLRKKVTPMIDAYVAVSDFLKKDLEDFFPNQQFSIIGNHINTDLFQPGEQQGEKFEFLHVSTLDPQTKNVEGILEACKLLKEENVSFQLTIVSDENSNHLETYAHQLGINEYVKFEGPLEWEALVPYYQKADMFVLFSHYETFSIVLAEAWSTGTPVIATNVGIAYNMDNSLGYSVETDNIDQLASKMKLAVQNSQFNSEIIRKNALQYSEESILKKWNQLISEVIG